MPDTTHDDSRPMEALLTEAGVASPAELADILRRDRDRTADYYANRGHIEAGAEAVARARAAAGHVPGAATIEHGGETFVLSPVIDVRVQLYLERERVGDALALVFAGGRKDVDRLLDVDAPLTPERIRHIVQTWAEAGGVDDLGGSSASSS